MDNINRVFEIYDKYGGEGYIGEKVTQLEHATQAALLAEDHLKSVATAINPKIVILGAFLHDIGHLLVFEEFPDLELMGNVGVKHHEEIGAYFLKKLGFPFEVCELVRNHINTKRFLITINSEYYDKLSSASKKTFNYQGGEMSREELINFSKDDLFPWHLKLRQWDDMAKSTDPDLIKKIKEMNPTKYYKDMARQIFDSI
jgi:2-amino-1-hydroxyethylphosphonate dioxygenase (glycine-forming)